MVVAALLVCVPAGTWRPRCSWPGRWGRSGRAPSRPGECGWRGWRGWRGRCARGRRRSSRASSIVGNKPARTSASWRSGRLAGCFQRESSARAAREQRESSARACVPQAAPSLTQQPRPASPNRPHRAWVRQRCAPGTRGRQGRLGGGWLTEARGSLRHARADRAARRPHRAWFRQAGAPGRSGSCWRGRRGSWRRRPRRWPGRWGSR